MYPEEEIWTRLQIREFAFRFGDHFELDSRTVASLQNLQGNWRIKRLSTSLAWKLVTSMEAGLIELPLLQRLGSTIVYQWMEERGLINNKYLAEDAARIAFAEALDRDGLSVRQWQDLVGVLESAGFTNVPQPKERRLGLADELVVVRMICDLLLYHNTLRKQWLADRGTSSKDLTSVEVKLKAVRFKDNDASERLAIERQHVELVTLANKSARRLEAAGRDNKGNEYWLFNDLATSCGATDSRNSEPFWGHGVIVIGPGMEEDSACRWWHVSEISDIIQLRRWLETEVRTASIANLCASLTQRTQYLRSLEWIDAHNQSRKISRM
ncbi:hypothetical protein BX666DRAFT_1878675 [Dichotomocladium elegans]|nr:hypothetical protein BX666DRAFT_1878675 [Dichotomocladium elegans]